MTSILQAIIERPKTVLTMMVVVIAAGIISFISIPREAQPDIDVPVYFVGVSQQGVSPGDVERLLVRPLETTLRGINGLKELTAISSEGRASVILEFQIGGDKDKILSDIREKVNEAKAKFPDDAGEPTVSETNFSLQPTIIVTLSGDIPERTLTRLARQLKDELESISTVRDATLSGHREEVLEVILDLAKLESYDITQSQLLNALRNYNQLVPAGFVDDGQARFNIKVPGLVESAQDVFDIPIKQSGEAVVTLGDVTEIRRTFKQASSFTRVNGKPAISLEIVKRLGTNIIENNLLVREAVGEFTKDWPKTVRIDFLLDQSNFIFEVLGSLQSSIMTAIILVMICVVWALGVRSGLLVGLAIPGSFMVAFLIVNLVGMTLSMMVMFGMVLTVGMLVDGAIVVTEYADRKIAEGASANEAYKRASKLMFWPVVSSTATTLAAFLPLLLWPGVTGEFMSYLPKMVIIVLSASLITALVFLPVTGIFFSNFSNFIAKHSKLSLAIPISALLFFSVSGQLNAAGKTGLSFPAAGIVALVGFALTYWFTGLILKWRANNPKVQSGPSTAELLTADKKLDLSLIKGMTGRYLRLLNLAVGNIYGNIATIFVVLTLTVASFVIYGKYNTGVEFFVDEEPDVAIVLVSARGNFSAVEIRDLVGEVEKEILNVEGVKNVVMTAFAQSGGPGGAIGGVQDKRSDVIGQMQMQLSDYCCRRKAKEIFKEIRDKTRNIAGIIVEVKKIEGGPPVGKDLVLDVRSGNYEEMTATVARLRAYIDTMELLTDQEDDRPLPGIEWELHIDRKAAGRYNAGIPEVGAMVQLVTNGVMVGKYRPNDSEDEVEIRVRLPEEQRSIDQFGQLKLRTPNGQVPLSNFITSTPKKKISNIVRRDGNYSMKLKASLRSDAKFGNRSATPADVTTIAKEWVSKQEWPTGVSIKFAGGDEEQQKAGKFLGGAALAALFMMFIILVTQFNSFYQTLLTLSTVIMAISGVLYGMVITGQAFSIIMTGTGVVALAGIVVNNAIVLIDTYNRLRQEGVSNIREAVLKTAAQRLRPVLLTTITTILGLIPMAVAININFFTQVTNVGSITAIWWVQLSTAIIAGLAYSTILTLVMIPAMLALPYNATTFAKRLFSSKRKSVTVDSEQQDKFEDGSLEQTAKPVKKPIAANDGELIPEAAE